ncbi:MAG: riboflavin biosynthesis protein RibF [Candidatus Omnitrophota bacterium]|nr:MAG: riboflavin biosynthesis protein RibF [Candidatus Omnitrophota bacterium]
MRIFYNLNDFLKSNAHSGKFLITLGVFDGVHRAHQKIIRAMIKKAKRKYLSTMLITFDPHPANILKRRAKVPLLISLKHRLRLLNELGLDYVIVLRFTKRLSHTNAVDFIKNTLSKIHIDEIIVGRNFFFGRYKKGTFKELKKYGYRVSTIGAIKSSGKVISSTWIRNLILKGNLKKASSLLSRPVTVLGTVIKGHKRGRIIGYPTANINPHHEAIPPSGVYAVKIISAHRLYKGILNIGVKPTFKKSSGDRESTIEVHIFNFNKHIYGEDLEIIFVKKIRREKKFKDMFRLKKQIRQDEKFARRILH